MLDLTDAERDLLISDLEEALSWQIIKEHRSSGKLVRDIYKNLLRSIQWDVIPDAEGKIALELLLEDLVDEEDSYLHDQDKTVMRLSILNKVYRW